MTLKQELKQRVILTVAHNNYEQGLNSYAFFKTHNNAASQDLVQDTFMKAWIYLVKGGKIEIMKAFLYHVLNDLIVDRYRKIKEVSFDALLEEGLEPIIDNTKRLMDVFDCGRAMLLIERLPEKYQKVMRMRYVQSLSLKEMALITGQSRNTMAVQAHRGLGMLKSLYFPA